jgi:hypothetical protein
MPSDEDVHHLDYVSSRSADPDRAFMWTVKSSAVSVPAFVMALAVIMLFIPPTPELHAMFLMGVLYSTYAVALITCIAQTMLLKRLIMHEPEIWPPAHVLVWIGVSDVIVFAAFPLLIIPLFLF